jgi:hypothetical protein
VKAIETTSDDKQSVYIKVLRILIRRAGAGTYRPDDTVCDGLLSQTNYKRHSDLSITQVHYQGGPAELISLAHVISLEHILKAGPTNISERTVKAPPENATGS